MTNDTAAIVAALRAGQHAALVRWVLADLDTPVSAYAKLREVGAVALLESVEGGERWGRYSIIGLKSGRVARIDRAGQLSVNDAPRGAAGQPFAALRELVSPRAVVVAGLDEPPPFLGGWIGYLGYGTVKFIEPSVPDDKVEPTPFPEAEFLEIDVAVLFDNVRHALAVIALIDPGGGGDPHERIAQAQARVDGAIAALSRPLTLPALPVRADHDPAPLKPHESRERFEQSVRTLVAAIAAGEAIQVVLSQRFEAPLRVDPFTLYRALRLVNPSPYLFYLELAAGALIGSSPEVLVRSKDGRATLRPIAGTRKRGSTAERDAQLERELLADPKERAEHVMLVDLGRNDLGRVCQPGTVRVTEQMVIERYSHVMHIVSNIEGALRDDQDAVSLLAACFPAGTVSGAPKVRAMQLIEEVEACRRGPYAGAVGYFDLRGNMDMAIVIRTFFAWGDTLVVHAGAGIVADSDPASEYQETLNKAGALFAAVALAESGLAADLP